MACSMWKQGSEVKKGSAVFASGFGYTSPSYIPPFPWVVDFQLVFTPWGWPLKLAHWPQIWH